MDKQAVFDQVLFNMRAQGKPAIDSHGNSLYHAGDLRCPIGWVLDDLYDPKMEHHAVASSAVSEALIKQTGIRAQRRWTHYLDLLLFGKTGTSEESQRYNALRFYEALQKTHDQLVRDLIRIYREQYRTTATYQKPHPTTPTGPHFDSWMASHWLPVYEDIMQTFAHIHSLHYTPGPSLEYPEDIVPGRPVHWPVLATPDRTVDVTI